MLNSGGLPSSSARRPGSAVTDLMWLLPRRDVNGPHWQKHFRCWEDREFTCTLDARTLLFRRTDQPAKVEFYSHLQNARPNDAKLLVALDTSELASFQ